LKTFRFLFWGSERKLELSERLVKLKVIEELADCVTLTAIK
jgi:hypothetical protein